MIINPSALASINHICVIGADISSRLVVRFKHHLGAIVRATFFFFFFLDIRYGLDTSDFLAHLESYLRLKLI